MVFGSVTELMTYVGYILCVVIINFDQVSSRDEEYKQKVEHSVEPVMVTFISTVDDKCKAVASSVEELSGEFTTIKFYQVEFRKHAMLSTALSNEELPIVVFVKNGTDFLTLTSDVSLPTIREGLRALQTATY
jgi:thioredoxin 1